jgi:phospholipid/cholesterol/gamma-HCH transport system substrate-binding protein
MASRGIGEVLTGAAVLLAAAGFLVFAVARSGRTAAVGYQLHANFDHIDGLNTGADVRIAGVKIGNVLETRIDPKTFLAHVILSVKADIRLPKDSSAEVTSDGLLGGKFLNLSPGGDAENLPPDGTVAVTQSSISLEALLGKFIFSATSLTDKGKSGIGPSEGTDQKPAAPKGSDQGALK